MKSNRRAFFCVATMPVLLAQEGTPPAAKDRGDRIHSLLENLAREGRFQGVALVAEQGDAVLHRAYGLANAEWRVSNTISTKFRVASITKTFTAAVVLRLAQEGVLKLRAAVTEYLPAYPKEPGERITLHHLLAHTSGLINDPDVEGFEWSKERLHHTPSEMLALFSTRPLMFAPGRDYRYSNFGYYLLAQIVATVTGKRFGDVLREQIFDPLQMENTSTAENKVVLDQRASGYFVRDGRHWNAPPFDTSVVIGAGDIISTAGDLLKWDQALYTDMVLRQEYRDVLFRPTMPEKDNYAYGWYVSLPDKHPGATWARHSGSINGFSSILVRYPQKRQLIVLLSNLHGVQTIPISSRIHEVLNQAV